MASQTSPPTTIRFDSFELDAISGELRKSGIRVRLQPQPFRVLLLLIEASGEVVTREEIRECLWKNSTFVDFEHGINFSINQIRGALSDSADHPRYVETLPRRGYRFIGTVERPHLSIGDSAPEVLAPKIQAPQVFEPQTHAEQITALQTKAKPAETTMSWRRWAVIASAGVLTAAIAGAYFFHFFSRRERVLAGQGAIVLSDFANATGDPAFDGTLRRALSMQLKQSPFLSVLSDERIRRTLPLMGKAADAPLTSQVARDLCMRTGSTAVVDGSIASLGGHYVVGLDVVNCHSGDSLDEEQIEAARKEDVLKVLGTAATRLRERLGESLSTVERFDTPLEVTTPSLEALRLLELGYKAESQGNYAQAIPLLQQAIRLDPKFAVGYGALAGVYSNLGEIGLAAENTKKAYELSGTLSEREKLGAEGAYYGFVTGDLEKQRKTSELLAQLYPRYDAYQFNLGNLYESLGQYEKGLEGAREAVRLDPSDPLNLAFLADAYVILNRLGDAQATIQQAQKIGSDSAIHGELYLLAFLEGDAAGMSRQLAWAGGKPGIEDLFLGQQADTSAHYGRLADARGFSRRAVASAELAELKETAGGHAADIALIEALMGNQVVARQQANIALKHSNSRTVQYGAALALALANESAKARSLADDLARRFPEDTLVRFNYLPTLRAQLALNRKSATEAIDTLQTAIPYDMCLPDTMGMLELSLYPVYVRGNAYLAAHRGSEAAAEFRKILDQRGAVSNETIGALAHLGLGRAYAANGDVSKSLAAYQDFFAVWKDADPGIPRLVEAKAEYAKLK